MNKLNEIQKQIEALNSSNFERVQTLKDGALKALSTKLNKNKELQKLVTQLQDSKELTQIEHDDYFHTWIRADFSKFIDIKNAFQCELFSQYMSENHFCEADFKNDCLSTSIGPAILINHDGDVLDQDSSKWFLKKSDYEDETERNEMIENYMDKHGYFPSVIRCDYYGNAFFQNTIGKK